MSFFYGIPTLQAVTSVGATTSSTVTFNGSVFSTSYLDIGGSLNVTALGTYSADQNILTNYFWQFGDAQEIRVGYDGSLFLIDTETSGSGVKIFFGDGATATKVTCGDLDCQIINGTTLNAQAGFLFQTATGTTVLELKSTATNDDPIVRWRQNRTTSTNGTAVTIDTIPTTTDTCIMIDSKVIARRTGGTAGTAGDIAAYGRRAAFKNVGGVLTQVGTTTAIGTYESQVGWDCTIVGSGTNILVQGTGALNNNVTWHSTTEVYFVGS